jgi:hypothetical protein
LEFLQRFIQNFGTIYFPIILVKNISYFCILPASIILCFIFIYSKIFRFGHLADHSFQYNWFEKRLRLQFKLMRAIAEIALHDMSAICGESQSDCRYPHWLRAN